jgi:hypothetical protein
LLAQSIVYLYGLLARFGNNNLPDSSTWRGGTGQTKLSRLRRWAPPAFWTTLLLLTGRSTGWNRAPAALLPLQEAVKRGCWISSPSTGA